MTGETPRTRFEYGPFVQVACFCETVIEAKDGTFSAIRIIDTVTHTQSGPEPPESMPPFPMTMLLLLMLKSGNVLGRRTVQVRPSKPNGEALPTISLPAHFEGDEKGVAIQARFQMQFDLEGLYEFGVYVDGEKLTSVPLRVRYNPITTLTSR